ncbi:MAG: nicotinate-nucleotide adenylyltransferase [Acidobacteriota bacterium]|jgi:nicotinate-nucleotide adenylyltransferase|nr:nicotinate-nucleotide adenylyltransferase [Acidobacteriota bacterium]
MNIGICGGTFDPFHRGHLDPVLAVREQMRWDRILYIPAYRQPFKAAGGAASGYHRFAMATLATREHDDVFVSPMELERGEISYSVDTLEVLRRQYPDATLDWIIGDDNVADLGKWKSIDRIFELANFVVLSRTDSTPGEEAEGLATCAMPLDRARYGNIVYASNDTVPISATEIRRRLREGEPIDGLVDPLVSRYIHHYRLYQEPHA